MKRNHLLIPFCNPHTHPTTTTTTTAIIIIIKEKEKKKKELFITKKYKNITNKNKYNYFEISNKESIPLLKNFMQVLDISGRTALGPHFCRKVSTDFSNAWEHSCNAFSNCCSRCWWENNCSWWRTLMRTKRWRNWSLNK